MRKKERNQKSDNNRNPKRTSRRRDYNIRPEDLDDDVDTFHKQRDIIPLDINGDGVESSDDEEAAVLDYEGIDDDEDDDDEEEEEEEDTQLGAKIKRQQKYLREKYGASDDEIQDEEDENEKHKKDAWGGKKHLYYGGGDYEGDSSDSDVLKEEENELLRLQKEKADTLSMEDFGLDNVGDRELTMEELPIKDKRKTKDSSIKDLPNLSRKEQMEVVYSEAPELVGLLSELNDALEQLEFSVNPLLSKLKTGGISLEGGLRFLEVKQQLLLAYCQAITFYLLLKSEGQSVCDHPVIARLVEIKGLLEKIKPLDDNISSEVEEFLKKGGGAETGEIKVTANGVPVFSSKSGAKDNSSEADEKESAKPHSELKLVKRDLMKDHKTEEKKNKCKTDQVSAQSVAMLKVRAELEEKLKQKGIFSSLTQKNDKALKHPKSVNGKLETYDDFNDDAVDVHKGNGEGSLLGSSKLSQLVSAKPNKPKAISGDDDLPKRDDIGERRRKHEMRVLASAGIKAEDDTLHKPDSSGTDDSSSDMEEDGDTIGGSENEFYEEVKQKREAKFAAKADKYTRRPVVAELPETVDGKRNISREIEKNRGLTRQRRKDMKNPRKKYRTKHDKQKKRWKGQVQQVRKPQGSYGGEATGINAGISRSVRF